MKCIHYLRNIKKILILLSIILKQITKLLTNFESTRNKLEKNVNSTSILTRIEKTGCLLKFIYLWKKEEKKKRITKYNN